METQQYHDGKWHAEVSIEEPYKEGCEIVNDKGARTSIIEHCYCKGDLCNSSNKPVQSSSMFFLLTLIVILGVTF